MPGPRTLVALPSHILNAITRLLEFTDAYRLGKLSGDITLWTKFRLGGYTEMRATTEDAFAKLMPLLPTFDFMPNLTHFSLRCDHMSDESLPTALWVHRLPSTLLEIRVDCTNSSRVWLRPLDPALDDPHTQFVAAVDQYVPLSMKNHFPNLRVLNLLGVLSPSKHTQWSEGAIRRFILDLPPSITRLCIPNILSSLQYVAPVAPSTEVLQNLDELAWSMPLSLFPPFASMFGCPHALKPNLSKKQVEKLAQPLQNLRELSLPTVNLDSNLFPFLCALSSLQFLHIASFQCLDTNLVHLSTARLPTSLTYLNLRLSPKTPFGELFIPLSSLTKLDIIVTELCGETLETGASFAIQLPCNLKTFICWNQSFVSMAPLDYYPPSLTHFQLQLREPIDWPEDVFEKATSLRTIELSKVIIFRMHRAPALPRSLAKFATDDDKVTLFGLSLLPKNITDLEVSLSFTWLEHVNFVGISTFTNDGIAQWLREKSSLIVADGSRIGTRTVKAPFKHLQKFVVSELPLKQSIDVLGETVDRSVTEAVLFGDLARELFKTLPPKLKFLKSSSAYTPQDLPSGLETATVRQLNVGEDAHDLEQHQLPALTSLRLNRATCFFLPDSSPVIYPFAAKTFLPALRTLHLSDILPSHASALIHLPSNITELKLSFELTRTMRLPRFGPGFREVEILLGSRPAPTLTGLPNDWLPNLKILRVVNAILPLRDWLPRLSVLDTIIVDRFLVQSDVFPQLPANMTIVTGESIDLFLITQLLKPSARSKSHLKFQYEWNRESLGKLPNTMTSLRLECKPSEEEVKEPPTDFGRHLPPTLLSLSLRDYIPEHFAAVIHFPRGLTYLTLVVTRIKVKMLKELPQSLRFLYLRQSLNESIELTAPMATALPKHLSVLKISLEVLNKKVLEALPRSLRSLTVLFAQLDDEASRLALPPLVSLTQTEMDENSVEYVHKLAGQLLKDIPTLQYFAGEHNQNYLVDHLSPCYPHHPDDPFPETCITNTN